MIRFSIDKKDEEDMKKAIGIAYCSLVGKAKELEIILNSFRVKTNDCFSPILTLFFNFYNLDKQNLYSDKTMTRINALESLFEKIPDKENEENFELRLHETEYAMLHGALYLGSRLARKDLKCLDNYVIWGHSRIKECFGAKIIKAVQSTLLLDSDQKFRKNVSETYIRYAERMNIKSKLSEAGLKHCFSTRDSFGN